MTAVQKILQDAQKIYLRVNHSFKTVIQSDPTILREDSARSLLTLISQVKKILKQMNSLKIEDRTKYFNVTYNAIVYISDIATVLKKSNYGFESIKQLLECTTAMEANIILQDAKYLDKRTKIYLDICHIYEENQMFEPAVSLLQSVIRKYKQLKELHEMDPPIPTHIDLIIKNNLNILKVMLIKYSIQGNIINPNQWKKKVDEQFGDNNNLKLLSLVECLKTQTRKQSNIFQKSQHSTISRNFKQILLQAAYDMIKPYADVLTKYLTEQKQKIERQIQFVNTRTMNQSNLSQQQLINEEIKKKRAGESKYTKQHEYKKASSNFPFQYHAEMINYAFESKSNKVLEPLLELALLRIQCRRIQVPYVNDVGIIASSTQYPNIPNGYEKIQMDLNEANLRMQLKKLRRKNAGKKQEEAPPQTKDIKKGGKDVPKALDDKEKQNSDEPNEEQLEQIKHKYVYMILKKTMSPDNAVYGMNIIMGDEEQGPAGFIDTRRIIIPYVKQQMQIEESRVKQYRGIKESTHLAPYIILWHSKSGLQDQSEQQTMITDVKPLLGKNPMIPPEWGFSKIPVDLRQVPEEFINNQSHEYVYITYKTEEQFHISSRHVKVLNALKKVNDTFAINQKVQNVQDEKMLELQIKYDLDSLNNFFIVLQECLEGKLGQNYYMSKGDFLTHLVFYMWTKYIRNPLIQFDYVNELKLNDQLLDYDYEFYRQALKKCKPIFLKGLTVFNFIMVNNTKSDILLLSRINLQLLKLLEQELQYKLASENGRMCLDRIRIFRDMYLTKGIKGNQNKLLPFSLTCSNYTLENTIQKMKKKYVEQRNYIQKLKRIKNRKNNKSEPLTEQQLKQQEEQFIHYRKNDQIDEIIQKTQSGHSQLITMVSAIQLDIFNIFFRVSLKYAGYLKKQEQFSSNGILNGIKQNDTIGLASSIKQKLSLPYGKNEQKNQKNLKQLQSTLIQADKLPPPKPGHHKSEKKLIEQFQKNPYAFSLLMTNFAAMNSQSEDKKYFLQQALTILKNCISSEEQACKQAIEQSIFLFSTLWDDTVSLPADKTSTKSISPFMQLYNGIWPCQSAQPSQPILITKNSTTISMKIPPFMPISAGKKKKIIKNMTLFGKPSANGVDVSTNCNQLDGTGLKNQIDEIVTVTNLKPHNVYCFAVAPTNQQEQLEDIGKTSPDVSTSNPLPIPMLACYLSKISYQINQFDIAEKAATIVLHQYCEKSGYKDENQKDNILYTYKFNQKTLKSVSLLEIRSIAESIYILALCERKRLIKLRESKQKISPVILQQKQKQMTNYLLLASLLNPSLTSPINSLPYLIPNQYAELKALSLSLIPPKWLNSKHKQLGIKTMQKIMKWGLQKNQISMARRIMYKWSQRKYLMLGKIIQIQEKKEVKKGAKEPKDQEVKMIDKYCRMLIEKNVGSFDMFQDSVVTIGEEYSDYITMFVERAKEQITYFSQFVDNPPQQLEQITNNLNLKVELAQYLKDPLPNIKKIPETSQFYLQYNCKILKKAIQAITISPNPDYKTLTSKSQQLNLPASLPNQLIINNQIKQLIFQAIQNDIQWSPSSIQDIIGLQQKTGKDLSKQIELYGKFEQKIKKLTESTSKMDSLINKAKDFDYMNLWVSQLYHLKAVIAILNCGEIKVQKPFKSRFDKVRLMNLDDLLKKSKQIQILDKQSITYSAQSIQSLSKILKLLCQSSYACLSIQNWIKLQNNIKLAYNLLGRYMLTPFYHKNCPQIWTSLAFLSLLSIQMLNHIRKHGFQTFKTRYNLKQSRTQLKLISNKLSLPYQQLQITPIYNPQYYMPELNTSTTKNYWFTKYEKQNKLDIDLIGSFVAYTVQTLQIEEKYNLVVNVTRQFCNVVQHYYSLQFLPFMVYSQGNLIGGVKKDIQEKNQELNKVVNQYTKKKSSKPKNQRQQKLTQQKPTYQIQYEKQREKITESMKLLLHYKSHLDTQVQKSQSIIQDIKRDTSKTVIKQRQQRKYMLQFGDDQQNMFRSYGDDQRLLRNRKNALKDIIEQYERIYSQLKNNKTSKDPLSQINNRNDVGNLLFASGMNQKATQLWSDALATIFKTVRPIDNYLNIIEQNTGKQQLLINSIGQKQVLLSLNLLYKISMFGSYKRLYSQYNCTDFVLRLAFALFENDHRHPQTLLGHSTYRLTKLSNNDPFIDEYTINLSQLMNSLQYFSMQSWDQKRSLQPLPLLTLYEHLATDIIKDPEQSIRSKLLKIIVLSSSGLIAESISYMGKVYNQKDIPNLWVENDQYIKRQIGSNWYFEQFTYDNNKNWNQGSNKQCIEWLKKLAMKKQFINKYGIINEILFQYCRALILAKIHQFQIYDNYQLNQQRIQSINEAEIIMRSCLKRFGILEEHFCNLEEYEALLIQGKKNQMNEEIQKKVAEKKSQVIDYLKKNGVDEAAIHIYESQQSTAKKRNFRIEMIARIRFSIYETYSSRKLTKNAYFVLKNGITNLHRYSYGARKVQTGNDPEISVVPASQPAGGKKQDKKGGKKQQVPAEQPKQQIDWKFQKNLQKENQTSLKCRPSAIPPLWHIKYLYELIRLSYLQNNYKQCISFAKHLIEKQSAKYEQNYYSLFAEGYLVRSYLKLGNLQIENFLKIVKEAEDKKFYTKDYLEAVMDLGEIVGPNAAQEMFQKGVKIAQILWAQMGMKLTLNGLHLHNPQRIYTNKQELTPQQEQQIARKGKKAQKKGGKDDKKAAKKQDPKKKKQQQKIQYNVEPLSKFEWWNLLNQQKQSFDNYIMKPHPNFHKNNIYSTLPLLYSKCYFWHLLHKINHQFKQQLKDQVSYIQKLLKIIETYPVSGYYYQVYANYCIAQINKITFINRLKQLIENNRSTKIKMPYQDLPLNNQLIKLPEYSAFIFNNRELLVQADNKYKKIIQSLKNSCLLFQNNLKIDQILWKAAQNQLYLAQYKGRLIPKYFPLDVSADAEQEDKISYMNQVAQSAFSLELSIKTLSVIQQLRDNYSQIGSKPLQPNAKIDQDIINEIVEIDAQHKANYPQFIMDSIKPKNSSTITSLDMICYMMKVYRESDLMTFTNSNLQSSLLKLHRILSVSSPAYKEKCMLTSTQYTPKKTLEQKFIEKDSIFLKSLSISEVENFLYILGAPSQSEALHEVYYGRLIFNMNDLSALCERLYSLRSKMAVSMKKSEAVKQRDFTLYKKELNRILMIIAKKFSEKLNEEAVLQSANKIETTHENLSNLITMFENSGIKATNKEINQFLRVLHCYKYRLTGK